MPPKEVVCNPYAKKARASRPPASTGFTSASASASASSSFGNGNHSINSNINNSNSNNSNSNSINDGTSRLLPSDCVLRPGSFSQAFERIDDTEHFRRASDSFFANDNPDDANPKKKETFRLVGQGPKQSKLNHKNHKTLTLASRKRRNASAASTTATASATASTILSNRNGAAGVGKPPLREPREESSASRNTKDSEGGADPASASASDNKNNNNNENENENKNKNNDTRIHHTLLQPHVLYASTRQKGNSILPLIRNVPVAYSPMVPDYILGATTCALFLSIKYHKLYPRYVHRRIAELRDDFAVRVLLVRVDVDDNANSLLQLNTLCVAQKLALVLCWSDLEAARYLETYKVRDGRDAGCIRKRESAHLPDRVVEFLGASRRGGGSVGGSVGVGGFGGGGGGGGRGVNKTDALSLWTQFSTMAGVAAASQDELALVPGMGPFKVRRLHDALHRPFSSLKTKRRKKQKQQEQREQREQQEQPGKKQEPQASGQPEPPPEPELLTTGKTERES